MVAVLGVGGFGVVVACKNKHNSRKYALKIVQYDADHPTQDALSLIREQKLLQTIKHPNIIKVYQQKQLFHNYIVMKMELAEESLSQFIAKYEERHGTRAIPEETCAKIMLGLFRALQHLHDNVNMIHRDVKLENIVIGSHNNYAKVKLIDFGLAVQSEQGNITDFVKCGTHLYRPPEQVSNIFSYAKVSKKKNLELSYHNNPCCTES